MAFENFYDFKIFFINNYIFHIISFLIYIITIPLSKYLYFLILLKHSPIIANLVYLVLPSLCLVLYKIILIPFGANEIFNFADLSGAILILFLSLMLINIQNIKMNGKTKSHVIELGYSEEITKMNNSVI